MTLRELKFCSKVIQRFLVYDSASFHPARNQAKEKFGNIHSISLVCNEKVFNFTWYHGEPWWPIFKRWEGEKTSCPVWQLQSYVYNKEEEDTENHSLPWLRAIRRMPENLRDAFTMNGQMEIQDMYFDDAGCMLVFFFSFQLCTLHFFPGKS